MDDIGELLQRYYSVNGDERREILAQIVWFPERREDPRILPFCLVIASDPEDYDLARIEVYKWLEYGSFPNANGRNSIGQVIQSTLKYDSDNDVRAYAAGSAWRFLDVDGVMETATAVLLNPAEDEIVRWNAFTIVDAIGPTREGINLAQKLCSDPTFSTPASNLLRKWKNQ